ncbi:MAG: dihydroorotate dehydrogenase (quinone) [Gammaproteobacteria bacterium]
MSIKLFSFLTKILHLLPGEISHFIALRGLKAMHTTGLLKLLIPQKNKKKSQSIFVTENFKNISNRLGIAAGLDKNGQYIDCLAALGIGFIEIGTVTPKPQNGNPKPRLFRNKKEKSLTNRLGFNNNGVSALVKCLEKKKSSIKIGISIGKNFDTPNEDAHIDYTYCMDKLYMYADYLAINISSPNTAELRELGKDKFLLNLLNKIEDKRSELIHFHGYKPIFVKISPDESEKTLTQICSSIITCNMDGIICSNTTVDHDNKNGPGGLSGAPLKNKSTSILKFIKKISGDKISIIASGGVMSSMDYIEKINAGADLVQIYTGFIYEGPKLIKDILNLGSE